MDIQADRKTTVYENFRNAGSRINTGINDNY